MMIILTATGKAESVAQFLTVLVLFVLVLAVTVITTRWVGNYQRTQAKGSNVELIEAQRLANGKYVQIVKIGKKYLALAVCKDTVTVLTEIPEEEVQYPFSKGEEGNVSFKELFSKVMENAKNRKDIDGKDDARNEDKKAD